MRNESVRGSSRRWRDGEKRPPSLEALVLLVPATGIELVTYRLQGGCSTN